jgi:hypothetical protein
VEGILVRKKNQFRLVLSVDMLAKSVAVEIDSTDVEPIAPSVQAGRYANGFTAPTVLPNRFPASLIAS